MFHVPIHNGATKEVILAIVHSLGLCERRLVAGAVSNANII